MVLMRREPDPAPAVPSLPSSVEPKAAAAMARGVAARLVVRISILHVAGGLGVFAYLQQIYPASEAFAIPWLNDFLLVVITEVALAPVAWIWVALRYKATAGFALEGRAPTAEERSRVLDEPWRMAARPFVLWIVAATAISSTVIVRGFYSPAEALDLAQIMLMGGAITCAVSYLVIEQTYKPLFALALAGESPSRPASLGIRPRLLLAWAVGSGVPLLALALIPLRESGTSVEAISILGTAGLLGGAFSMWVASHSIASPLDALRDALGKVAEGELDTSVQVNDGGDVGQVQVGFNRMMHGLRERVELQDLFSRHVGHEVAQQALEQGTGLGGESRRASVIFVDLIGSTAMAEVLPPGEVVATLNAFFRAVVDTVQAEGGWVNKFEGDGALCIFGVPGFQPDHEARALRAARALHARLAELTEAYPGLDAGIGVSTGTVVAGNVGTEERYEYTVIGRAVNEAARLTDLAKQRPGRVLASAASVRAAGTERDHWADRGRVGLRGQQTPTAIFEPAKTKAAAAEPSPSAN